ncbi:MAG: M1 family metallopeptidase [Gemmatimonadota bacterium]
MARTGRWTSRTAGTVAMLALSLSAYPATAQEARSMPAAVDSARSTAELMARPVPGRVTPPAFFRRAVERGTRTETGAPGEGYWTNRAVYEIDARLDPETARLEGTVTVRYENRSPVRMNGLAVHLHQNLHAPGVMRNESQEVTGGVTLERVAMDDTVLVERSLREGPGYQVRGSVMRLRPVEPLEPGDSVTLMISWSETLPQNGAGRMGHSGHEVYMVAYWFPKVAVFDDLRAWDAEPYLGNAEFYDDFADYRVSLTVPQGWTVAATGTLLNPEEVLTDQTRERLARAAAGDDKVVVATTEDLRQGRVTETDPTGWLTWHFAADTVRDFAWSTSNVQRWDATSAVVPDRDGDGSEDRVLIQSFWREDRAPLWARQWEYGKQSIDHHSRFTGFPYPWPHMTSVEGADIIGGGMEFPMMTLIGPYQGREPQDLFNVTSHELAHMWVPMIVGSNEKRHAWMDEGSTTFLENVSRMEYWPGVDHYRLEEKNYVRVAAAGLERSMMRHGDWYEPGPGYGTASYAKPATLMVMLRELIMRPEAWDEAYRTFISEWAYKHPTPWDFFNTFERFAQKDLDWFWTSFYYRTWTIDHQVVSVEFDPASGSVIHLRDGGDAPFPLRVRIRTADGGVVDRTVPVEHWLEGHRTAEVRVPAEAGAVIRVELNPSGYVADVDRTNDFWPRG